MKKKTSLQLPWLKEKGEREQFIGGRLQKVPEKKAEKDEASDRSS